MQRQMSQTREQSVPDFLIRRATQTDSDAILACLRSAFHEYESRYTPGAYADTILTVESLSERLLTMSVFVAVSPDGQVIGTIACNVIQGSEGHLRGMAVRPEWQGYGVAKKLLDRAEAELRDRGCQRVTLDTTEPLKRAVHFYELNGFRSNRKVTDFFGMPLFEYAKEV